MGTPDFAVPSLKALHDTFGVAAVVTAPDKPSGRGRKIIHTPVKEFALSNSLALFQPEKLRNESFVSAMKEVGADLFVVVAFRMLPEEVWTIPRLGTFNMHASLLPAYRGAAPNNRAVMNGETRTGLTTFLIDREIDTGRILLSQEVEITPEDDAGSLHDRMMVLGADLVVTTVKGLVSSTITPVEQVTVPGSQLPSAPKIFPSDTVIDWTQDSVRVHNLIRGLSPWPGASTVLVSQDRELRIKIYRSKPSDETSTEPGYVSVRDRSRLLIGCGIGSLEPLILQPEGRKRMTAGEFISGYGTAHFSAVRL